ncbi:MAG: DinB family protein [Phycisphaerales bacterium]
MAKKSKKKATASKPKRSPAGRKPAKRTSAKPAARSAKRSGDTAAETLLAEKVRAMELLAWTHEFTGHLTADFPNEHLLYQAGPSDNHVLWTLGHLTTTYSWLASLIDGKAAAVPEDFIRLFGYQSKPVGDATAYPSHSDVLRHHHAAFARLMEAIGNLKPEDAHKPTVTDSGGFAKSRLDAVLKGCWHEGWHQGQVSSLRRSLGLPSKM